ncbi:hypothetical protein CLOP_g21992 [Closterium sp. NIES-67]|nr:hypothetical protein CLOP_g21992 [Closterium sp. NIES-67]
MDSFPALTNQAHPYEIASLDFLSLPTPSSFPETITGGDCGKDLGLPAASEELIPELLAAMGAADDAQPSLTWVRAGHSSHGATEGSICDMGTLGPMMMRGASNGPDSDTWLDDFGAIVSDGIGSGWGSGSTVLSVLPSEPAAQDAAAAAVAAPAAAAAAIATTAPAELVGGTPAPLKGGGAEEASVPMFPNFGDSASHNPTLFSRLSSAPTNQHSSNTVSASSAVSDLLWTSTLLALPSTAFHPSILPTTAKLLSSTCSTAAPTSSTLRRGSTPLACEPSSKLTQLPLSLSHTFQNGWSDADGYHVTSQPVSGFLRSGSRKRGRGSEQQQQQQQQQERQQGGESNYHCGLAKSVVEAPLRQGLAKKLQEKHSFLKPQPRAAGPDQSAYQAFALGSASASASPSPSSSPGGAAFTAALNPEEAVLRTCLKAAAAASRPGNAISLDQSADLAFASAVASAVASASPSPSPGAAPSRPWDAAGLDQTADMAFAFTSPSPSSSPGAAASWSWDPVVLRRLKSAALKPGDAVVPRSCWSRQMAREAPRQPSVTPMPGNEWLASLHSSELVLQAAQMRLSLGSSTGSRASWGSSESSWELPPTDRKGRIKPWPSHHGSMAGHLVRVFEPGSTAAAPQIGISHHGTATVQQIRASSGSTAGPRASWTRHMVREAAKRAAGRTPLADASTGDQWGICEGRKGEGVKRRGEQGDKGQGIQCNERHGPQGTKEAHLEEAELALEETRSLEEARALEEAGGKEPSENHHTVEERRRRHRKRDALLRLRAVVPESLYGPHRDTACMLKAAVAHIHGLEKYLKYLEPQTATRSS